MWALHLACLAASRGQWVVDLVCDCESAGCPCYPRGKEGAFDCDSDSDCFAGASRCGDGNCAWRSWGSADDCCLRDPSPLVRRSPPRPSDRADLFSVLNVNAFLLEVRKLGVQWASKPDMDARSRGLAEWFLALDPADVPDAVVFNEVFSEAGEELLQRLCDTSYRRGGGPSGETVLQCAPGKPFGQVTRIGNAVGAFDLLRISSGVVVAVRPGLTIDPASFHEEEYHEDSCSDSDCFARKGFVGVQVRGHAAGRVAVVGTHTQAWAKNAGDRRLQWAQLRKYLDTLEGKVVVAGDMNAEEAELAAMRSLLGAEAPPVDAAGFWLEHDAPLAFSTLGGGAGNALLHYDPHEAHAKSPHDQVLHAGEAPKHMRWQYVPLKSAACFATELGDLEIDDLSDHYAAYGELCYGARCAARRLPGHRGASAGGCCPGRGLLGRACYDWAPGGAQEAAVGHRGGKCVLTESGCAIRGKGGPLLAATLAECHTQLAGLDKPLEQLECA